MVVLVNAMHEEDQMKNQMARDATTLNIDFSKTQGQLTRQSVVQSVVISNTSKIL